MKTKVNLLSKLVMFFLLFASTVFSQNITNTLGTNGVFTIKDASNNFLTLSQATGQVNILRSLRLENTTSSSLGVLFKGTDRFLHNYGSANTFLGINSGNFTMTGSFNTALGYSTLFSNTTGDFNTALGQSSLFSNTTGYFNTAEGFSSLNRNTIGMGNTAVGSYSLYYNTTGSQNTALGNGSLTLNTTGENNTAVGSHSLFSNTTGKDNTALGYQSLTFNRDGNYNTAVGDKSLFSNIDGSGNTTLGAQSLYSNTYGRLNTAVGDESLFSNISGDSNTAVGLASLYRTTGNRNTALGYFAGFDIITGNNLTCIGNNAQPITINATDQITLGDNQIVALRCNVQTISSLSDARDKKNIKDLSLGLDFLMKVKPRLFNWDKREWYDNNISDGSKMKEAPTAGFIAQELDEVQTTENAEWMNLVLKDNPEKFEATSGNLLPVMVKAIQELKEENDKLKQNNEKLSAEVVSFKSNNEKLSAEVESFKSVNEKLVKLEQKVNELTTVKHTSLDKTNQTKTISYQGEIK